MKSRAMSAHLVFMGEQLKIEIEKTTKNSYHRMTELLSNHYEI